MLNIESIGLVGIVGLEKCENVVGIVRWERVLHTWKWCTSAVVHGAQWAFGRCQTQPQKGI